jgi:hypothetical protein
MDEFDETTEGSAPNRTMMILLGVIAVLLVAIVAIILLGRGGSTQTAGTPATGTGTTGAPAGMGAGTGAETPFDPATATKVEAGKTPEDHVKTYFDAVVAGDFSTAFKLLPASKQAEYGSEATFAEQLTGYGVTGYSIDSATEEGDEAQVTATANMPGGAFQYLWVFVKDGDTWLVKSRTLPGMN